jgi:hypothetical protein
MELAADSTPDDGICPVCNGEMEDRRHVSVECFYDVHEVAPYAEKDTLLQEVPHEGAFWGITRRYPEGTRDKPVVTGTSKTPGGYTVTHIENAQEPIPSVRVIEKPVYTIPCCKDCRAEFLHVFGKWAKGELVCRAEPSPEANIPVRENGAIRYITREEWDRRRSEREKSDNSN